MTNIAIIGGTFDPVHIAHVEMAKYLLDNKITDEVWILPSYKSPHKDIDSVSSYEHRINMLRLAFDDIKNINISRFEEEYATKYPDTKTYTYEILEELKKKYNNYNIHFVLGFDPIKEISTWHRYLELLRDFKFYIFDRDDNEFKTIEQKKFYLDNLGKHQGIDFKYRFFDYKVTNISSTSIRSMLKNRAEYTHVLNIFINKNVLKYITENKLYL